MAGVLLLPAGLNPVTAGGRPVADAEAASAAQQDNIVRGTVLDERGETLVGVSVIIQGTSTGTATDAKGRFEIRAKRGDVLVVSSIGFITENVTVLKGAAATALYGSRGANGAIVIVSKGGKYSKQGLGVEVNQTVEVTDVHKSPVELQNIYGAGAPHDGYQGDFQPTER